MAKVIPVSFKKGEEDLHSFVLKHSDKSCFIKDCIKYFLDNKETKTNEKTALIKSEDGKNVVNIEDLLNFK